MRRLLTTCLLGVILLGGGWALVHRDEIHNPQDVFRLVTEQMARFRGNHAPVELAAWAKTNRPSEVIRIASFNIQSFGLGKANNHDVMRYLAEICRKFDLVAIQEIRNQDQSVLPNFVRLINDGLDPDQASYGFVISPSLGRSTYREQSAFIINQRKVQLDNAYAYTVNDPDDVMIREPFVGWFRSAQAKPEQAFTFSLVNLHLDAQHPKAELTYLDELFRAVRKDGRGEDDVLLIGDFNIGTQGLERAGRRGGLTPVLRNVPTNTRASQQYDNILLDLRATAEFTGQSGAFDFLREFNLTMEQALEISDHLPVWADFSILEGESVRRVAADSGKMTSQAK